MRTQEEIVTRYHDRAPEDFLGFEVSEYIRFLDWEHVQEFLKEGVTSDDWDPEGTDKDSVKKIMLDYMDFAWKKAINCRGISAGRSLSHYMAWIWMLGDEEVKYFGDLTDYQYYGKDELVKICERYGWDHAKWDDGIRSNTEY